MHRRLCGQRRSSGCGWQVSTSWKASPDRRSWRLTPRRVSRASKSVRGSTLRVPSSTTLLLRWIFRRSTFDSALTVSRGYGVTEIYVPDGSRYVGASIRDSQFPERDINVLTLYRGNKVIPNPRLDRVLEAHDKLLCFGKLEEMRELVPQRTRRRRRPKVKDLPDAAADD